MTTPQERAEACAHLIQDVHGGKRKGFTQRMSFPADGNLASIVNSKSKGLVDPSEASWTVTRDNQSLVITGQPEILAIVSGLVKDLGVSDGPDGTLIVPLPKA